MTIQNIFYICGIIVFSLTSILIIILISSSLGLSRKAEDLLDTFQDSMESNVVGTIVQLVPLLAAIFTEFTDRKPRRKRK